MAKKKNDQKKVTRYTYEGVKEPSTPETGHTKLLPSDDQSVTLQMDNGWSKALQLGRLPEGDGRPVIVDMDPAQDPVLFWSGKRSKREIPVLPLQKNEIISESRIAQIIERVRKAAAEKDPQAAQGHLFADLEKTLRESEKRKRVEFYTHEEDWKNKLICGDSLQVMESLLHYEGLRGKVQMIYIDPPYGIKYDSNFQQRVDSTKNDEKDQADDVLTIKAFRDTWALGIHSYLSYLQERLYLCRELLTESGSIFVQINDENAHRVRLLMDEVFGAANLVVTICFKKKAYQDASTMAPVNDFILWYAKSKEAMKYRPVFAENVFEGDVGKYRKIQRPDGAIESSLDLDESTIRVRIGQGWRLLRDDYPLVSQDPPSAPQPFELQGVVYEPTPGRHWSVKYPDGLYRLAVAGRLRGTGNRLYAIVYWDDDPLIPLSNFWDGMKGPANPQYVVQTSELAVQRCVLMTTEPGDVVFDPTCGGGTTAVVAEQWGRRWMTCDTSRVAINVARKRLLAAVFDHYKTRNGILSAGFLHKYVNRVTLESLAHALEPEKAELVDQPEVDKGAIRVTGPFEVMTIGRYSIEDWKGYVKESGQLYNYIDVICRLYRRDAAVQGASGLVHAVAESEKEKIAISVGPVSGRVTGKQINDAVQDALASGMLEVHVLGWAFEANVGEIKSQLESRGRVKVELIMIRPDTLAEGLKATNPSMLFSPLALPDIEVKVKKNGKPAGAEVVVTLKGVAVFDRKARTTEYKHADSGYISAWYLDEDYDGDCFVDCQMFYDFGKTPNLKAALRADIEPEEFKLRLLSQPFPVRGYKRIAVKVVDVFGNESTVVKDLG